MHKAMIINLLLILFVMPAPAQVGDLPVREIHGAGAAAPVIYQADERDLANAIYTLKDGEGEASALVNWTNGLMKFTGVAMSEDLMDEEGLRTEARDYAYVKAREFLEGIIVGREATYEDKGLHMVGDGQVTEKQGRQATQRAGISVPPALIRTGPVIEKPLTYLPHPTKVGARIARAEAVVALLLYNADHPDQSLIKSLLPDLRKRLATMEVPNSPLPSPMVVADVRRTDPDIDDYTGLIIDTRGQRLRPVASPEVYVEGQPEMLLYGALQVDPKYVATIGIAGWSNSPEQASKLERVGPRPLVITASGSLGTNSGAVLVSGADANRVMAADKSRKFLSECRVAFIVD